METVNPADSEPVAHQPARLAIAAATTETHDWVVNDRSAYSRSEARRQNGPYQSCVPAIISDWQPMISAELSADIEDTTAALVEFDHYTSQILGPNNAAIMPMSTILLRTESASSSQIEHLTVGAKQLALAEITASKSENAQLVIGNVRATEAAIALSIPHGDKEQKADISISTICNMHQQLLSAQPSMAIHAGKLRDQLVWIGHGIAGPRKASFVAPQPELVRPALEDLVLFANRDDLPVLLQIAVTHAQFETIHPFVDGNGRTGRALVQALLHKTGMISQIVPLSAGLLTDTSKYFVALTAFRHGDVEPIVRAFSQAGRQAVIFGKTLITQLADQLTQWQEKLADLRPQSKVWQLLPQLISQPVINTSYVCRVLDTNTVTANRTIETLVKYGILVEQTGKSRNRIWQQPEVLDILDNYASQIRRNY